MWGNKIDILRFSPASPGVTLTFNSSYFDKPTIEGFCLKFYKPQTTT